MATPWGELVPSNPITLVGEVVGRDANDQASYSTLTVIIDGGGGGGNPPLAPVLSGAQPTRTSVNLSWTPADNSGRAAVTAWEVQRRSSLDNGSSFGAWAPITGSPFSAGGASGYSAVVAATSPSHYYPLDSTNTVSDIGKSAKKIDAVNNGSVAFGSSTANGTTINAAKFNGTNYLECANNVDFSVTGTKQQTIMAHVTVDDYDTFADTTAGYTHYLGKGASGTHEWHLRFHMDNDATRPRSHSGSAFVPAGGAGTGSYIQPLPVGTAATASPANLDSTESAAVNLGAEHVIIYQQCTDGSFGDAANAKFPGGGRIYFNGVLKDSDGFTANSVAPAFTSAPLRIGQTNHGSFAGRLRRVGLWNRLLTQTEINTLTSTGNRALAETVTSAPANSASDTGLPTGTPEVMFEYRARGINGDGNGDWSNIVRLQWSTIVVQAPTAPTNLTLVGRTTTTRGLSWTMSTNNTVDKCGIFDDGVLIRDNLPATSTTYTLAGLTPGAAYNGISVARHNSAGWSPLSNTKDFIQPTINVTFPFGPQMMGVSSSSYEHGGTEDWDGWRTYSQSSLLSLANRTTNRPLFIAYSKDGGQNMGGTRPVYSSVFAEAMSDLNMFYYTSATGQTRSSRWGIKLFYSNGNENSAKGALSTTANPDQQTRIDLYTASIKGLYDACHYIDPTTGVRRFPDAYAGSNPTQNHEQQGIVAYWLHPTAIYHDFVMWSMYDPGRKSTVNDPTYNWPALTEASIGQGQTGSLIRCFYRTNAARAAAQAIDPTHNLVIGMGEGANGIDPDDPNTRPYWAVHAFAGAMSKLSDYYNLEMPFACWWDSDTDPTQAGSSSDGRSRLGYDFSNATPPRTWPVNWTADPVISTREAWQNWRQYNRELGGTLPAAWAGLPSKSWKTGGTVV